MTDQKIKPLDDWLACLGEVVQAEQKRAAAETGVDVAERRLSVARKTLLETFGVGRNIPVRYLRATDGTVVRISIVGDQTSIEKIEIEEIEK